MTTPAPGMDHELTLELQGGAGEAELDAPYRLHLERRERDPPTSIANIDPAGEILRFGRPIVSLVSQPLDPKRGGGRQVELERRGKLLDEESDLEPRGCLREPGRPLELAHPPRSESAGESLPERNPLAVRPVDPPALAPRHEQAVRGGDSRDDQAHDQIVEEGRAVHPALLAVRILAPLRLYHGLGPLT